MNSIVQEIDYLIYYQDYKKKDNQRVFAANFALGNSLKSYMSEDDLRYMDIYDENQFFKILQYAFRHILLCVIDIFKS